MGTGAPMVMGLLTWAIPMTAETTPDAAVLTRAQWLSPAYPVGAFACSQGLAAAVDAGWVADGAALEAWLAEVASYGAGRNDALFIAAAYHADGPEAPGRNRRHRPGLCGDTRTALGDRPAGGWVWHCCGSSLGGGGQPSGYPVAIGATAPRRRVKDCRLPCPGNCTCRRFCPTAWRPGSGCRRWGRPGGRRSLHASRGAFAPSSPTPQSAIFPGAPPLLSSPTSPRCGTRSRPTGYFAHD